MQSSNKVKVVTGKVRFSYANVFEPKVGMDGGTPKYSVSILIPKSDKEGVAKIQKAFEECKASNAAYFGGSVPKMLKGGLRDGDTEREDEAYAGHFFINANSAQKPDIIDASKEKLFDNSEFYSGCFGRASVTFYPYSAAGSKGIACGLNNLQKLEDGEKLGGGSSAAADFAD
jgi:hypothetical protein